MVAALRFDLHQTALDGTNAGGADVAVFGGVRGGVVAHMLAHGAQVFHVEQQKTIVVGDLEHQLQHAFLGLIQIKHAGQQQRPKIAHGGAHRMTLVAKNVPQGDRERLKCRLVKGTLFDDFSELVGQLPFLRDTGQIPLDVGHEDRHTQVGKAFRQSLQGNGLAGTCGTGDQSVAIGLVGS